MSDIESMKAELEAAKIKIAFVNDYYYCAVLPSGTAVFADDEDDIKGVYEQYRREKKFAAMEALLEDMLGNELYLDTDDRCHPSTQLTGWIRRAEELLK